MATLTKLFLLRRATHNQHTLETAQLMLRRMSLDVIPISELRSSARGPSILTSAPTIARLRANTTWHILLPMEARSRLANFSTHTFYTSTAPLTHKVNTAPSTPNPGRHHMRQTRASIEVQITTLSSPHTPRRTPRTPASSPTRSAPSHRQVRLLSLRRCSLHVSTSLATLPRLYFKRVLSPQLILSPRLARQALSSNLLPLLKPVHYSLPL
jgi:hypothetical protein